MPRNKNRTRKKKPAASTSSAVAGESSASAEPSGKGKTAPKFVVGLDFGTTYTSVFFAHSTSQDRHVVVDIWPDGQPGEGSAYQVPTVVEYTPSEMIWGYQVVDGASMPGCRPLNWFKLLLVDEGRSSSSSSLSKNRMGSLSGLLRDMALSEGTGNYARMLESPLPRDTPEKETRKILGEMGITPVNLIGDFLEKVKETTLEKIKRTYPMQANVNMAVEWILTVPAIWDDAAKNSMVQAAKRAGLGERGVGFELTSEPECGATYSLRTIQDHGISPGDVFVVCDAGGGTVDLISYKVSKKEPLHVDEVVASSGELCGSVFLDRRFEDYIRRTLGDKFISDMKPDKKAKMMHSWEEMVKFKFGNKTRVKVYEVFVPGSGQDAKRNVRDDHHYMKYEDVKAIFDPVVDSIISLVSQQVSKVREKNEKVKSILLIGGLGCSMYLFDRLANHTYDGDKVTVLRPPNPRTAIARGALIRGFSGSITKTRLAPRSYGSTCSTRYYPFLEEYPPGAEQHVFYYPPLEMPMVHDLMSWYVVKGTEIKPTRHKFNWRCEIFPGREPDLTFVGRLYSCKRDEPPEYRWQDPASAKLVCSLVADLSFIPRDKFRTTVNSSGQRFLTITIEHQMTLVNEVWVFELLFEGKRYGVFETNYIA